MIKVSVFYPYAEGNTFNFDYYCNKHMPMVLAKLGEACKGAAVDRGLGGPTPDSIPTFLAMGHMYFESVSAFQAAYDQNAEAIGDDMPNYTNVQPTLQISEVKL